MLTYLLGKLTPYWAHMVMDVTGTKTGWHEFLHGFCPCEIDLDLGEEDLDEA